MGAAQLRHLEDPAEPAGFAPTLFHTRIGHLSCWGEAWPVLQALLLGSCLLLIA